MKINYIELEAEIARVKNEPRAKSWTKNPRQLVQMGLTELTKEVSAGRVSSEELTLAYLESILEQNQKLNAIVTLDAKGALERARLADLSLKEGKILGPLHGIPFTIKDTYETQGLRSTAGHKTLVNHIPDSNAVVVQRLIDAGAILMGKTNTPALAMDMQTSNEVFGTTVNIDNPSWTAGGSSGGSSVAVAAHMTAFEFGTDLAGSIRLPAAFNGVYGFRPTFGLLSMRGHIPPKPGEINGIRRMATAGPITAHIEDLAFLLRIVAGPGVGDHRLDPLPQESTTSPRSLKDLKIAWTDDFEGVPVSQEIKSAISKAIDKLQGAGATTKRDEPKDFPYVKAWETWGTFVGAQGGYEQSNFARALGSFFTKGAVENTPMQRNIVGPISIPSYMEAMQIQDNCIEMLETFFDNYDLWIVPVSSTTAFDHQKPTQAFGDFFVYGNPIDVDGQKVPYYVATQSYTTIFSLTESPVVTIPLGRDQKGAFIGVQLVGKRFGDLDLLKIAGLVDGFLSMDQR